MIKLFLGITIILLLINYYILYKWDKQMVELNKELNILEKNNDALTSIHESRFRFHQVKIRELEKKADTDSDYHLNLMKSINPNSRFAYDKYTRCTVGNAEDTPINGLLPSIKNGGILMVVESPKIKD